MTSPKLESPSVYFLAGSTGSGKSRFVAKLIRNRDVMFKNPPKLVRYAYKEWQPQLFGELQEQDDVVFHQGLPSEETIKGWSLEAAGEHVVLVLDDLQSEVAGSASMVSLFSIVSHHCNISIFWIAQNAFPQSRFARDLALQAHFLILFSNHRDRSQVSCLARQICPGQNKYFTSAYDDAVTSRKFHYLFVDLHPTTPREQLLRTDIFPGELTIFYLPK